MDSQKLRRRLRLWLAIVVLVFAVGLLIVSALPPTHVQQILPMPPVILPSPTPLSLLALWRGI